MKKRFLLTSALMLLLTVLALTSATYAWFSMSTTNKISDITITATSADGGLEISSNGSVWNNTAATLPSPSISALDITTPNGKTFYKSGEVNPNTGAVTSVVSGAVANTDYYEYDFYLRTSVAGTIYLDLNRSYIIPEELSEYLVTTNATQYSYNVAGALADNTLTNGSSLGTFTRDWIAAAARFSLEVKGYQRGTAAAWSSTTNEDEITELIAAEKPFICEPFSTTLALKQDAVTNAWTLESNKVKQNSISGVASNPTSGNVYELTGDAYAGAKLNDAVGSNGCYDLLPAASNQKVALIKVGNTGGYTFSNGDTAIIQVTLRIWIEGQDDEAKSPLALGKFLTGLTFTFDREQQPDYIALSYAKPTWILNDQGQVAGIRYSAKDSRGVIAQYKLVDGDGAELTDAIVATGTTYSFAEAQAYDTVKDYKFRVYYNPSITESSQTISVKLANGSEGTTSGDLKYFDVSFVPVA